MKKAREGSAGLTGLLSIENEFDLNVSVLSKPYF